MGSGEADAITIQPPEPRTGRDDIGKWVMRCANCKNKIGWVRGGEWAHAIPTNMNRCREIVPYRAPQ